MLARGFITYSEFQTLVSFAIASYCKNQVAEIKVAFD